MTTAQNLFGGAAKKIKKSEKHLSFGVRYERVCTVRMSRTGFFHRCVRIGRIFFGPNDIKVIAKKLVSILILPHLILTPTYASYSMIQIHMMNYERSLFELPPLNPIIIIIWLILTWIFFAIMLCSVVLYLIEALKGGRIWVCIVCTNLYTRPRYWKTPVIDENFLSCGEWESFASLVHVLRKRYFRRSRRIY